MRFVDTNVLLYAVSTARNEQKKARIAREILDANDLALSVQVIEEFYVQATRTTKRNALQREDAVGLIEAFLRFPVQETTLAIVAAGLETKARFQISYWDAAIIEAARSLRCGEVVSEDLSDGQDYDGVVVRNPFKS